MQVHRSAQQDLMAPGQDGAKPRHRRVATVPVTIPNRGAPGLSLLETGEPRNRATTWPFGPSTAPPAWHFKSRARPGKNRSKSLNQKGQINLAIFAVNSRISLQWNHSSQSKTHFRRVATVPVTIPNRGAPGLSLLETGEPRTHLQPSGKI